MFASRSTKNVTGPSAVRDSLRPKPGAVSVPPDIALLKTGLATCLALVVGSAVVLLGQGAHDPLLFALSVVFGLFGAVTGVSLLPGLRRLELSPQGFVSNGLLGRRRYDWGDVVGFRVIRGEGPDEVGFDFANRPPRHRAARLYRRFVETADRTVPPQGVPAVELAAAMNLWRLRYASAQRCTKNSASPTEVPNTTA